MKNKWLSLVCLLLSVLICLAGCSAPASSPPSGANAAPAAEAPAEKSFESLEANASGSVNIMVWGDYIDWSIPAFEEKYNVKVELDYYNSELEALNKLKAGRVGSVDLIYLGVGYEEWALDTDLIVPYDIGLIPNVAQLYPSFQARTRMTPDGPDFRVPFAWGTNSFMYNADMIPGVVDDLNILLDPQYKDNVSVIDRGELVWCYAALLAGRDINDVSDEAFEELEPIMRQLIEQSKMLWLTGDDIVQFMVNDEVAIALTDNGRANRVEEAGKNVKYVIPKQGTEGWIDYVCLCKDAPNPDLAMLFINYICGAEAQQGMVENIQYATPNAVVGEALDQETRDRLIMGNVDETLASFHIPEYKGMEWVTRVQELWIRLKSEAGV